MFYTTASKTAARLVWVEQQFDRSRGPGPREKRNRQGDKLSDRAGSGPGWVEDGEDGD